MKCLCSILLKSILIVTNLYFVIAKEERMKQSQNNYFKINLELKINRLLRYPIIIGTHRNDEYRLYITFQNTINQFFSRFLSVYFSPNRIKCHFKIASRFIVTTTIRCISFNNFSFFAFRTC